MKHLILVPFLALIFSVAGAQGNLQFNQVLRIGTTPQTVPTGKVWKVVSFWQSDTRLTQNFNTTTCGSTTNNSPFLINSVNYFYAKPYGWGSTTAFVTVGNEFPLWLPAGETLNTLCTNDFLSVIEFNIVTP
jgi:hypothetical protein